jgi:hypothetical protein
MAQLFMSRANLTGVTQRSQILEISFGLVHFLIFLKKWSKYKKIISEPPLYQGQRQSFRGPAKMRAAIGGLLVTNF